MLCKLTMTLKKSHTQKYVATFLSFGTNEFVTFTNLVEGGGSAAPAEMELIVGAVQNQKPSTLTEDLRSLTEAKVRLTNVRERKQLVVDCMILFDIRYSVRS